MSKYTDKFKDPRWQKKRMDVLNRADFACEGCSSKDKTLHIHHGYYEYGLDPWDYDDSTLWCLCEECHLSIADEMRDLRYQLAKVHPSKHDEIMRFLIKSTHSKHVVNVDKRWKEGKP